MIRTGCALTGILAGLILAACTGGPEYKGDLRDITDVPRTVVEREQRLLEERVNGWARGLDSLQRDNKVRQPIEDNRTSNVAGWVDSGRWVLAMFEAKLAGGPATVSFTRKEWGAAEDVYCRLVRE